MTDEERMTQPIVRRRKRTTGMHPQVRTEIAALKAADSRLEGILKELNASVIMLADKFGKFKVAVPWHERALYLSVACAFIVCTGCVVYLTATK
jgi:hypothetical protein